MYVQGVRMEMKIGNSLLDIQFPALTAVPSVLLRI
jgi:hypothetical protein